MKKWFITIIILLLPNISHAWDKMDTALQLTYLGLHVMDWGQTLDIAKSPNKHEELNPILGKHPSIDKVNSYFVLTGVGHTVISLLLPKPYRNYWQLITIGIESNCVYHNYRMGVRINF